MSWWLLAVHAVLHPPDVFCEVGTTGVADWGSAANHDCCIVSWVMACHGMSWLMGHGVRSPGYCWLLQMIAALEGLWSILLHLRKLSSCQKSILSILHKSPQISRVRHSLGMWSIWGIIWGISSPNSSLDFHSQHFLRRATTTPCWSKMCKMCKWRWKSEAILFSASQKLNILKCHEMSSCHHGHHGHQCPVFRSLCCQGHWSVPNCAEDTTKHKKGTKCTCSDTKLDHVKSIRKIPLT